MLNEDSDDEDLFLPSNIGVKGMNLIKSTPSTPTMIPLDKPLKSTPSTPTMISLDKPLKKVVDDVPAIDEGFDYVNFPSLSPD